MLLLRLKRDDDKRATIFIGDSPMSGSAYLQFLNISRRLGPAYLQSLLEEHGFWKYPTQYWFLHYVSSNDTTTLTRLWHRIICGGEITMHLKNAVHDCELPAKKLRPEYDTTLAELMWAICIRYETLAASLIEESTDLNDRDGEGLTALFWAVRSGSPVIVKMLLAKGSLLTCGTPIACHSQNSAVSLWD